MRIAFTHNPQPSERGGDAELDRAKAAAAIVASLSRLGHEVEPVEVSGSPARFVARLEALTPDLVLNTAEGRSGSLRRAFFPTLFAELGLPFAGSDAHTSLLALDPHRTRLLLGAQGIPARVLEEERAPGRHVVVSFLEKASTGTGGLLAAAEVALDSARIEPPAAVRSPGRDGSPAPPSPLFRVPALLPPEVVEVVLQISRGIVRALSIRDFGSIDFHVGEDGRLHWLGVDTLPTLAEGSLLLRSAGVSGMGGLDDVLAAILESAAERHGISLAPSRTRKRRLRVGLTFNLKRVASSPDGEVDSDAEYDSPKVIAAVKEAIASYGHDVVELEATPDLPAMIGGASIDVVFNMAEGIRGRNREAQVPAILELCGIPYSGSDAATMSLALDKALAKRVVAQAGILTAPFVVMTTGKERLPRELAFPAIVKPVAEGSSKGVLKTSVVEGEAELRDLVRTIVGKYQQGALVEQYLPGREFTVALLGERRPRVLPPMEIVFVNPATRRPVYAFDHKLDWTTELRYDRPARVDASLGRELERVARAVFHALGCRDLARVDLRLDAEGRVHFLEVNPLPGLSPGWSDLCLIAESAGMDYRTLIGEVLAPALRRFREEKRRTAVVA